MTATKQTDLLPCPFCGGEPNLTHSDYVHDDLRPMSVVECKSCSAWVRAEDWNIRAQSAPEPVQGEAVHVVGVRISTDGFGSYIADSAMGIGAVLPGEVREPLMTVAQHQRILLSTVIRCEQKGAFKICLECGYQDGHDLICQYHESRRAAASDDLTNVRCQCCQSEHAHNSYDAGFIAGSGMCQVCDAALPAKDLPAVSTQPVEWQYQAPDGSWWGIAKSRVDEARLMGRPIRALYTAAAKPDAELVELLAKLRQMVCATPENDLDRSGVWISTKHPVIERIDAKLAELQS